jgi:hypothetical protein
MRTVVLIAFLLSVLSLKAQTFLPGGFIDYGYRGNRFSALQGNDSTSSKKWFVTKYSGISTSFSFSRAGSATVVAAPMGIQLNRRLNNNFYAFAGVSVAPAYMSLNQSFLSQTFTKANQANSFYTASGLAVYSRAELGLQYINDERTFSISGSIGIERSSYPMPYYHTNNIRTNSAYPVTRQ